MFTRKDLIKINIDKCNCIENCQISKCCNLPTIKYGESTDILFIGQGAGYTDELNKEPFSGPAGKYLRQIIHHLWSKNLKFSIALSNTVRFRPTQIVNGKTKDRDPTTNEINFCIEHLLNDIKTINPKHIVYLGLSTTKYFINNLNEDSYKMYKLNGKNFITKLNSINYKSTVLYHPSFLLRQKNEVRKFEPNNMTDFDKLFINNLETLVRSL